MPISGHRTFIQDIQDGQGPDGPPDGPPDRALTALLKILNGRYSRYPGNILKNVQSPDSTTLHQSKFIAGAIHRCDFMREAAETTPPEWPPPRYLHSPGVLCEIYSACEFSTYSRRVQRDAFLSARRVGADSDEFFHIAGVDILEGHPPPKFFILEEHNRFV